MARPELGVKRVCPTTGKKFYDLNRDPIVSPYTGEVLARALFEPARRNAVPKPKVVPADDEADAEVSDAELISLEEADDEAASPAKAVPVEDDIEIEDEGTEDDTFLAPDEDDDDGGDVTDLVGDGIEEDEES